MTDPNLKDFYTRLARIEHMHARGYGFEAAGTLGRMPRGRARSRIMPVARAVLFLLIGVIGLKGVIHYKVGPDLYNDRVARLEAGEGFDRLGGVLMRPDPATLWVADKLRDYIPPQG